MLHGSHEAAPTLVRAPPALAWITTITPELSHASLTLLQPIFHPTARMTFLNFLMQLMSPLCSKPSNSSLFLLEEKPKSTRARGPTRPASCLSSSLCYLIIFYVSSPCCIPPASLASSLFLRHRVSQPQCCRYLGLGHSLLRDAVLCVVSLPSAQDMPVVPAPQPSSDQLKFFQTLPNVPRGQILVG